MQRVALLASVALVLTAATARAAGDPDLGKRQFAPCTACHTTMPSTITVEIRVSCRDGQVTLPTS